MIFFDCHLLPVAGRIPAYLSMRIQLKDLTTITQIQPEDKACITIRSKKENKAEIITEKISWQELEFVQQVLGAAQGRQTAEGVYIHEDLFVYLACEVEL